MSRPIGLTSHSTKRLTSWLEWQRNHEGVTREALMQWLRENLTFDNPQATSAEIEQNVENWLLHIKH